MVKGAFEAGALEVIASRGITVRRIVASSSGALNGTAYAAGVRGRREIEAARELARVWEEEASLCNAIHPSLRTIVGRTGISNERSLLSLLRRHVRPATIPSPAPVELHLMLAPLHGRQGRIDGELATTYSKVLSFRDTDFDTKHALERVFLATTASAALPVLFAPVNVPGVGPCTDGGLVNNLPVSSAFGDDGAEGLDAVVVITATPAIFKPPEQSYRGLALLAHELDMVFAEWIFQDLRRTTRMHEGLLKLEALAAKRGWGPDAVAEIRSALDLDTERPVPIVSIRPKEMLPGTIFSGFTDPDVRREYVRIGRERAASVLDDLGWHEAGRAGTLSSA